jgi:hypothetical protein
MNIIEEKLRKEATIISLLSSIVLLSVIQITFFSSIFTIPIQEIQGKGIIFFPYNLIFLIYYFVIPIVYCICISLSFNPKRIVSPINAQIMTMSFLTIMLFYKILNSTIEITDLTKLLINLSTSILVGYILLIEIGWLQLFVVRKVVGLNFGSIERKTIEIDGFSPEKIIDKLKESFLFVWDFNLDEDQENNIFIMKRGGGKKKWSGIIAVKGLSKNKSIISIILFQSKTYSIEKSEDTSRIMNELIDTIKGKLLSSNIKFVIKEKKTYEDTVSKKVYEICLDMIGSKFKNIRGAVKKIPAFYKTLLIILTVIFLIILVYSYLTNNSEMVLNFIIPTIIGLILEISSAIHDVQKKKTPF